MHLGLIIYENLNILTGGYLYNKILVAYLRQMGHQVDIISLPKRRYARNLLDSLSHRLRSGLTQSRYDILLQDGLNHPSLFRINGWLQRTANFPIVAIVHQVLCIQPRSRLLNGFYRAIEQRYFQSVDAFIYNSQTTRRAVELLVDRPRPSIVASPAGNRLGYLKSNNLIESRAHESGPLRLIFVGNLLPHKGLAPLIKGLSNLSPHIYHLRVIGNLTMDRPYVRHVKKLMEDTKISPQVELTGPKDGAELAHLLAQSHLFIMPYSHEGFGMAHLEAMAFGLPVVGSSDGAVNEFVKQGKNGFLIKPHDFKSVNKYLSDLDHDRQRLSKMSHAALRTFNERPQWIDTVESIHGFITGVAQSRIVARKRNLFEPSLPQLKLNKRQSK